MKKKLFLWATLLVAGVVSSGYSQPSGNGLSKEQVPLTAVSFYRLRFELLTTASATRITAQTTENLLTARSMGVNGNPSRHGVNMQSVWVAQDTWGDSIGITADYAVTPAALDTPISYLFEKRTEGSSILRVFNIVGTNATLVQQVQHTGASPLAFSLDLSALKSVLPLTGQVQSNAKMLWAFYYQWYSVPWNTAILQDQPQSGYYNSDDPALIAQHILQAKSAGIDGFIASWWGPPQKPDPPPSALDMLLDQAQLQNFSVIINFETLEFDPVTGVGTPRDEATILAWLRYAIPHFGSHPAYLKVNGKPVFVLWASTTVSNSSWQNIFDQLKTIGMEAVFIAMFNGEYPALNGLEFFDGMHTYNILAVIQRNDQVPTILSQTYATTGRAVRYYPLLADSPTPKIWAATVQPGYDDHLIPGRQSPILPRENGALYRSTFEAAMNSDPDWIFITTWNEWWEHTYIEPSQNYGDQYLQITREYAEKWKATTAVKIPSPSLPQGYWLEQNYPNPFNPSTTIRFSIPRREHVTLKVFDVLGREVATLVDGVKDAGEHSVVWNATPVPSGAYFYRLTTRTFSQTKLMEVIK